MKNDLFFTIGPPRVAAVLIIVKIGSDLCFQTINTFTHKRLVTTIAIYRSMKIIRAAFGYCIDTTAGEVTELHIIGRKLHLHFLDYIQAIRVGTCACAGSAGLAATTYATKRITEADSVIIHGAIDRKIVVTEVGTCKRVVI